MSDEQYEGYEWHANFALQPRNRQDLQDAVEGRARFAPVQDLYARLQLLAQSVEDSSWNTDAKSYAERERRPGGTVEVPRTYQCLTMTHPDSPDRTRYTAYIHSLMRDYAPLGFATPRLSETDLAYLPEHSFFLCVPFTLSTPYLSKDDEPFYVHENPLRKDWVLRVPYVAASGWKGSLRAALRYARRVDDEDPLLVRLLGNPKGEKEHFQRGRLSLYPTFLDALEVQVINPHSRETGAGKQPIHIEGAPRETQGTFALLYTPLIPEKPDGPLPDRDEVLADLEATGQATYTLLAELGFGAKTASGMGRAGEEIPGAYLLMHRRPGMASPVPEEEGPPERFTTESDEFLDAAGNWPHYESDEELEAHIPGNAARRRYKRQRMAYRKWLERRKQEVIEGRKPPPPPVLRLRLERLADLTHLRQRVEEQTGGGGHE